MAAPARLRPERVEDAAAIAELAGELGYPASTEAMATRLAHLLPQPHQHVMVAETESTQLGWIAVERRLTLESGEQVEIVALVVSVAAKRSGIGRLLVADAEHWAREQGFEAILLRSNVARTESHHFYEQLGYLRGKTQHVYTKRWVAQV